VSVARFVPGLDPPATADGPSRWFVVADDEVLLVADGGQATVPAGEYLPGLSPQASGVHFLGVLDGAPCWAVDAHPDHELDLDALARLPEARWQQLRALYGVVNDVDWTIAGRAVQLVEWARTHRFCGRCATPTVAADGERAMRCPACGLLAFPRLSPAVIVVVERDGGRAALLARGRQFPIPMYSALAGFVEPGETLEEAVHREVFEEVGIEIRDIAYVASQPWPFPHSLMIGFTAQWAGGEIVIDDREIVDAGWFGPDDLPPIPPPMSIARQLIDRWRRGASA
jgi:NAD+ diphosphatase